MKPGTGQPAAAPETSLFADIQNEVSAESAPLLQFITRYAGWIAGFVILLLLILGGMAIWNWFQESRLEETRNELAYINLKLKGTEKEQALLSLANKAPNSMQMLVYLTLGHCAQENNNTQLALEAYGKAATLGENTALGLGATLSNASLLLKAGKAADALALLQQLEQQAPTLAQMAQFRVLLAEAALKAGDSQLAAKTYQALSKQTPRREAAYYQARAKELLNETSSR